MKAFMDENFLLSTPCAQHLYHDYAEHMPIYDYHCHLSPKEIAENIQFRNIGHLMLGGDHYKWRAMSAYGYDNDFIRTSGDYERFMAFAKAMPMMIGNPMYHWTHLELKRVFGITEPLSEKTAQSIWDRANAMLATDEFRARRLIEKFNVALVCTTDDPTDDLQYHKALAQDKSFKVKVLPAFRPDKAVNVERAGFKEYIGKLAEVSGRSIHSVQDVIDALDSRVEYFHQVGARISDHGLDTVPAFNEDPRLAQTAFEKAMRGETVSPCERDAYRSVLLVALGEMYNKRGWAQQYHMNALRNNNTPAFRQFGPDTGYDSVDDTLIAHNLSRLLDAQESRGALPKTVLYSLNPAANYVIASMAGNFQGNVPGKIQMGSGWWFCDQRDGMIEQMKALSQIGLISRFIGMLTDSRSFVSYPRHEYFRRILCDVIGGWVENGEYPCDEETLRQVIEGICFNNAKEYFGIEL